MSSQPLHTLLDAPLLGSLQTVLPDFWDIAEPFETALNAVTKHLKLLDRTGLIERAKWGERSLISFRGEPLREVAGWVDEYERFWNERLDLFERHFKTKGRKLVMNNSKKTHSSQVPTNNIGLS